MCFLNGSLKDVSCYTWFDSCFLILSSRIISCSVTEISLENTSNESSFFVVVEHVKSLSCPERRNEVASFMSVFLFSMSLKL